MILLSNLKHYIILSFIPKNLIGECNNTHVIKKPKFFLKLNTPCIFDKEAC